MEQEKPLNPLYDALYMPRPEIYGILDRAAGCKLVYVIAGAGYGKTLAVQKYIEAQKDAVVRWVQLTESDNTGARYWENLTANVELDNPALAERLREFGFPDTLARFKQFAEILKKTEHRSHKTFLVLDDFHLIHSKQALVFAERCAHLKIPGACVIIISRTEPDINTVALFAKGQAAIVTEDELRFTGDEIRRFFGMRKISVPAAGIDKISEATGGWAIAIRLLALVLERAPGNIDAALGTMRQNVFKLIETEAWNEFPKKTQKTLAKLSLVSDLPLRALWERAGGEFALQDVPRLMSFMWFDSFTGQDRVHPLYWEFLKSRQDILSEKEIKETYGIAAGWCSDNGYYLDSVKYLASSRNFKLLLKAFMSYPHRLPPDTCKYFLEILENLKPSSEERSSREYILLTNIFVPLLLAGMERYDEAAAKCFDNIAYRKRKADEYTALAVSIAYSNLAYLDMYQCTVTHKYNAPEYLKKSLQYMKKSAVMPEEIKGSFAVADIRSFACLAGEGASLAEFDEFLEMAKATAGHVRRTSHSMYYGYDDLVACEIAFYKNNAGEAKNKAQEAIKKARRKNQHSIEAMAAMYLFRIAVLEGDYRQIKKLFREKDSGGESSNFWNRRFLYELAIGFLYAQIGLTKMMPSWLVADERGSGDMFEPGVPVRELICGARYLITAGEYSRALTLLNDSSPRAPHNRFAFGELTLHLLAAAAKARTGDIGGAAGDFEKAYALSCGGVFEMPFVELGKELAPLLKAIEGETAGAGRNIPEEWLDNVQHKASAYAKKTAVVLDAFKADEKIEDAIELSQREQEVLTDLYHGLSREEIAANRYLSVNTVHKIIQSVFLKLDAYNKTDAIRIAKDKKLL